MPHPGYETLFWMKLCTVKAKLDLLFQGNLVKSIPFKTTGFDYFGPVDVKLH